MSKFVAGILLVAALLLAAPAFAVDGVVLINQATVMAAGGFPYKITQPGSYKLSGNLVVPANTNGIDILAHNVTLDLAGFAITGPVNCTGTGSSISCSQPFTLPTPYGVLSDGLNNVTVRNGSVSGFATGVYVAGIGLGGMVEEISAFGNSQTGIVAANRVVRRNSACANGLSGIAALDATVTENVTNYNFAFGLDVQRATVTSNVANFNGGAGLNLSVGLYGSNEFYANSDGTVGDQVNNSFGISQKNNECALGATC